MLFAIINAHFTVTNIRFTSSANALLTNCKTSINGLKSQMRR